MKKFIKYGSLGLGLILGMSLGLNAMEKKAGQEGEQLCLLRFKKEGGQSVLDVATLITLIAESSNPDSAESIMLDTLVSNNIAKALSVSPDFIEALRNTAAVLKNDGLEKLAKAIEAAQK